MKLLRTKSTIRYLLPNGTAGLLRSFRSDVVDQRLGLVLHEDVQRVDPRVDEVAQDEVDDPVLAPERHGGLAALLRQRVETLALAAGQHDPEDAGAVHAGPLDSKARAPLGRGRCFTSTAVGRRRAPRGVRARAPLGRGTALRFPLSSSDVARSPAA